MNIRDEIKEWQHGQGIQVMKEIGFGENAYVIDFGCGVGNYTIPLSEAVGQKGRVYAVDVDHFVLRTLKNRIREEKIHNIWPVLSDSPFEGLPSNCADAFLVYDLMHMLDKKKLLILARSILKKGGILSVLPFHMSYREIQELIRTIEKSGFRLNSIQKDAGLHFEMYRFLNRPDDHLKDFEKGDIYNFICL